MDDREEGVKVNESVNSTYSNLRSSNHRPRMCVAITNQSTVVSTALVNSIRGIWRTSDQIVMDRDLNDG